MNAIVLLTIKCCLTDSSQRATSNPVLPTPLPLYTNNIYRFMPLRLSFSRRLYYFRSLHFLGSDLFVFKDDESGALSLFQTSLLSNEVYNDDDKNHTSNCHANCPVRTVVLIMLCISVGVCWLRDNTLGRKRRQLVRLGWSGRRRL